MSSCPVKGFPNYVVPKIDVRPLLKSILKPPTADPGVTTVSVDVLSIVGSASSTIDSDTNVFYDTEILAIIQRAKVKSSGLVDSKIWGWVGKGAKVGPKEEKALTDLAKRYGTKLVSAVMIYFLQRKLKLDCRSMSSNTTSQLLWLTFLVALWPFVRYVDGFRSELRSHAEDVCF